MTRIELLLIILSEECAEVSQRVSKALRFSLGEVQPGQTMNNADRIIEELADLFTVIEMLRYEDALPTVDLNPLVAAKKAKVEKYLNYSRECGVLD